MLNIYLDQYGDTITTERKDGWFHDETTGTVPRYKEMSKTHLDT